MDELIIFLSPGEKLRQARFELDITQEQLACEKLSRRAISTIESGSRKLNYFAANIIVQRVNELQKQLRQALDYDFTVDYLMEDIETQVTKEIEHIIEKLSNNKNEQICDELIKRAERIGKEYSVNEDLMIKINNLAIEFNLKTYNLNNALYFTNKNLKIFYSRKDDLNAFFMQCHQTRIYSLLEDYKSVISLSRTIDINDEIKKRKEYLSVCYNTALAYYYLNNYRDSMFWLEKIKQNELPISRKLDILNLKSNILGRQALYEESEKYSLYIAKEARENSLYDLEANSYSNISEVYRLKNESSKALEYINKALELNIQNYTFSMNIYRNALLVNLMCNLDSNIKKYFEEAFKYSTILKRKKVQFQLLNIYLKYCCEKKNKNEVKNILELLQKSEYNEIDTGVLALTAKAFMLNDEDVYKMGLKFLTKNTEITIE